jgi:hypothetical protein
VVLLAEGVEVLEEGVGVVELVNAGGVRVPVGVAVRGRRGRGRVSVVVVVVVCDGVDDRRSNNRLNRFCQSKLALDVCNREMQ